MHPQRQNESNGKKSGCYFVDSAIGACISWWRPGRTGSLARGSHATIGNASAEAEAVYFYDNLWFAFVISILQLQCEEDTYKFKTNFMIIFWSVFIITIFLNTFKSIFIVFSEVINNY